ncbi:hypothetical protein AGMMS49974_06630 [Deltaproteobacteria bacterium]|nr:hypothetical protein AGMMS49974_06630 [Deltaproteobacteria bacterium]
MLNNALFQKKKYTRIWALCKTCWRTSNQNIQADKSPHSDRGSHTLVCQLAVKDGLTAHRRLSNPDIQADRMSPRGRVAPGPGQTAYLSVPTARL